MSVAPIASRESARTLAANCAALLVIDDAQTCGLIDHGLQIHRGRCERLLAGFRRQGLVPDQEEIDAATVSLITELGGIRG